MEQLTEQKKEKQTTIIEVNNNEEATKEEFLTILRLVAPGTNLRAGINGIVDAKKGALIVVENDLINQIIDGGFKLNCRFTPQRIIELAKMDGAIILSKDMKRITFANVTLAPDSRIPTKETGTRHKAAERSAKMSGTLSIAVSERKNEISLYYKNMKYHLKSTGEILRSASETLQILEKQRELFDLNLNKLHSMEMNHEHNLMQASKVIQKGKAMEKILESQEKTIIELGNEAIALKLRIKELTKDVGRETDLIIKDYTGLNLKRTKGILETLSYEDLIDLDNIMLSLAQKNNSHIDEIKGWRILSKTSLSEKEIADILTDHKNLANVLSAKSESFKKSLGVERSQLFVKELQRIRNN
jgi:diadenylate cyclase